MSTTTIACPVALSDPSVDPETSPIWVDYEGNEYYVASGVLEGYTETEGPATTDRLNVAVNLDGVYALSLMGLTAKT